MKNLYEILEMIRPRPAMYLGQRSLTALDGFIGGYSFALGKMGSFMEKRHLLLHSSTTG